MRATLNGGVLKKKNTQEAEVETARHIFCGAQRVIIFHGSTPSVAAAAT